MSDINGIPDEEEMTEEVSGEQEIRPEFKGEYPEEFFTNPLVVNSSTDTSHNITVAGQTLEVPLHHLQPKAIGESQLQELNTERYADQDWHNQQANRQKKHMIHTEDGKKHGPFSSKENAEKFASSRKDLKSPKYVAESLDESSGDIKFHFVNGEMIHVHKGGEKIGHISLKDKGEYQFVPVKNRNFEGKIHTNLQDCTKEVMDTYSQDLKDETMEVY